MMIRSQVRVGIALGLQAGITSSALYQHTFKKIVNHFSIFFQKQAVSTFYYSSRPTHRHDIQLWRLAPGDWRHGSCCWPALRAGLLCCNFFGQPGSVSKFPPLLWVKLWVGWVGRGYTEISRYFPASWINWVTLVTKIKLLYSLRF